MTGLRRNPDIGSATYFCSCQNTVYYSWQTSMRKRTSHNIAFDLHYTWGKALSYAGGDTGGNAPLDSYNDIPDFFDVRSFRGPSTGDITHNVTGDFILDLPSLSGMSSAFVRQALGGWQFTGIIQATTGQPVLVTQSGAYLTMAEYVGGEAVNPNSQRDGQYLNKDAFVLLPLGAGGDPIRNGTLGNGAIRGPGRLNFDFGLGKNFLVGERVGFQLRVEAFNVFNHTPWSSFRTNINNSRFGEFTNFRAARQVQVGARLTF